MREYKTKSTAIKHIRAGENFSKSVFSRFWTDREVCKEAIAHHPSMIDFVIFENPDIEWCAEFMTEVFLRALEVKPAPAYLSKIGKYLPPEITDSKAIALRAAEVPKCYFHRFMSPNLLLDKDVFHAFRASLSLEHSELYRLHGRLTDNPKDLLDMLLLSSAVDGCRGFLENIRKTGKEAATFCADDETFRFAFDGLHDDEEFVLEVLKMARYDDRLRQECSYRIRKAARNTDLMNYLETVVEAKRLEAVLKPKGSDEIRTRNKTKI